jgi:hypothetical protein
MKIGPLRFDETITALLSKMDRYWFTDGEELFKSHPKYSAECITHVLGEGQDEYGRPEVVTEDIFLHDFLWYSKVPGMPVNRFTDAKTIYEQIAQRIDNIVGGTFEERRSMIKFSLRLVSEAMDLQIADAKIDSQIECLQHIQRWGTLFLQSKYLPTLTAGQAPEKDRLKLKFNSDQFTLCCAILMKSGMIKLKTNELAEFVGRYVTVDKRNEKDARISPEQFLKDLGACMKGDFPQKTLDRLTEIFKAAIQRVIPNKRKGK